jgi:hypothetical protein
MVKIDIKKQTWDRRSAWLNCFRLRLHRLIGMMHSAPEQRATEKSAFSSCHRATTCATARPRESLTMKARNE